MSSISDVQVKWSTVLLKDICERITKGSTPTSYGYKYQDEGIRFIKAENIDSEGIASSTSSYIDDETHEFLKRSVLQSDDLLFSIAGTIGRVGRVREVDLPANTNQALAIIRLKPGVVYQKYLFYYLKSDAIQKESLQKIVGVGRANLSLTNIGDFEIPIAPMEQQKRIVAEIEKQLSRLDEAVANLKRVKANLKRYKATVLKAAVEGKLTEAWRKQHSDLEPAEKLLERILAERRKAAGKGKYKEPVGPDTSGLPELPAGWVWASCEQLFEWSSGDFLPTSKTMTGEIPVYGGNGISGSHDSANVDWSTIIIGRVGAQCGNVHISAGSCWVTDNAIFAKKLPGDALLLYAVLVFTVANLNKKAAGSGQPFVNQKMLNAIEVPLPSRTEQHQIVAEVERRLSIVAEAEAQVDANVRRADRLRQSILKQAFSGRLVHQDPNDEPASALLERIRATQLAQTKEPSAHQRKRRTPDPETGGPSTKPLSQVAEAQATFGDAIIARILAAMQPGREYARADLADPLGLSTGQWNTAIQELKRQGRVRQVGKKRGAKYELIYSKVEICQE